MNMTTELKRYVGEKVKEATRKSNSAMSSKLSVIFSKEIKQINSLVRNVSKKLKDGYGTNFYLTENYEVVGSAIFEIRYAESSTQNITDKVIVSLEYSDMKSIKDIDAIIASAIAKALE